MAIQLGTTLGGRLKARRVAKGIKQTELSEQAFGKPFNSVISRYEKDKMVPSADILKKFCEILDVSSDYLLGLSDTIEVSRSDRDFQIVAVGMMEETSELSKNLSIGSCQDIK